MAHRNVHLEELLKLPPDERSAAAEALLESLEDEVASDDVDQSWADEIQRRIEENAPGIPADQAFAQARARLCRHLSPSRR